MQQNPWLLSPGEPRRLKRLIPSLPRGRRSVASITTGLALLLLGTACGDDCADPVIGMSVRLIGGAPGATCNFNVAISKEGSSALPIGCRKEATDCVCDGARDAPGTYLVTIQRGGTVVDTSRVVVEENACELVVAEFSVI